MSITNSTINKYIHILAAEEGVASIRVYLNSLLVALRHTFPTESNTSG